MSTSEFSDNMKRTTPWGLIIGIIAVIGITVVVLMLTVFAKGDTGKYDEQMDLGRKYVSELKYEQAILAYEEAIKIDPKNIEAYLALVEIYEITGDFEKAEEILAKAEANVTDDAPTAKKKSDSEPNAKSAKERIAEKKTQVKQTKEKVEAEKQAEATSTPEPTEEPEPTATPTPEATATPVPTATPTPKPEKTSSGDGTVVLEFKDGTKTTWTEGSGTVSTDGKKLAYVYFGSYPQSEVTGKALTKDITGAKYNSSGVATIDGVKYKRISKSDVTYAVVGYDGNYDWSGKPYAYFKYEPIKWRVLSSSGSQALLLAEYGLDVQKYHKKYADITWENCTFRSWLNNDFISNAFSKDEKNLIKSTKIVNDDNPEYGTEGGANTTDKVFLLSLEDMRNTKYGFSSDWYEDDVSRRCATTQYAKAMGAWTSDYYKTKDGMYSSYWWLRSPGYISVNAANVNVNGRVSVFGIDVFFKADVVRPALYLNLSSIID